MKSFPGVIAGVAVYCVNDVNGELGPQPLLSSDVGLSNEEITYLCKCFYNTEINLKAKLRGLRLESFQRYFTVLKEDSFLSKKKRRGQAERIILKNTDFEDHSPAKEVLSFISLIEQHTQ